MGQIRWPPRSPFARAVALLLRRGLQMRARESHGRRCAHQRDGRVGAERIAAARSNDDKAGPGLLVAHRPAASGVLRGARPIANGRPERLRPSRAHAARGGARLADAFFASRLIAVCSRRHCRRVVWRASRAVNIRMAARAWHRRRRRWRGAQLRQLFDTLRALHGFSTWRSTYFQRGQDAEAFAKSLKRLCAIGMEPRGGDDAASCGDGAAKGKSAADRHLPRLDAIRCVSRRHGLLYAHDRYVTWRHRAGLLLASAFAKSSERGRLGAAIVLEERSFCVRRGADDAIPVRFFDHGLHVRA